MKRTLLQALAIAWFVLLSLAVYAQGEAFGALGGAIRGGSSKDLAQYFSANVELGFDGDKQSYSSTQAEFVMKDFFSKNPPAAFDFIHYVKGNDETQLAVGKYSGKSGSYRVFVKVKPAHGTLLIDAIDFTKDAE